MAPLHPVDPEQLLGEESLVVRFRDRTCPRRLATTPYQRPACFVSGPDRFVSDPDFSRAIVRQIKRSFGPRARLVAGSLQSSPVVVPLRQRENMGYWTPVGGFFSTVPDLAKLMRFRMGYGPNLVLQIATLESSFHLLVALDADLLCGRDYQAPII